VGAGVLVAVPAETEEEGTTENNGDGDSDTNNGTPVGGGGNGIETTLGGGEGSNTTAELGVTDLTPGTEVIVGVINGISAEGHAVVVELGREFTTVEVEGVDGDEV